MAIFTITYRSDVLKRDITFKASLPADFYPDEKYRTLYMLHGLNYNYEGWLKETRFDRLARDKKFAVIFPDGQNSFYVNGILPNSAFDRQICEELVSFTRRVLPLSDKREDTFIGGFSMGGFGAIRNGLKHADTFSKILSFSAAIHLFEFEPGDARRNIVCGEDGVFGPYEEAVVSDKNPAICLKNLEEKVKDHLSSYPEVYMVCGLQDNLLDANRSFKEKLEKAGVKLEYHEYEGIHSHEFVAGHLNEALDWLLK